MYPTPKSLSQIDGRSVRSVRGKDKIDDRPARSLAPGDASGLRAQPKRVLILGALLMLSAWVPRAARAASDLLLDTSDGTNWPGYGRTYGEQHYSPLEAINGGNIGRLSLTWSLDLPPGNGATIPIAVDGVVYAATGVSTIRAIDAASGKELWTYDLNAGQLSGDKLRQGWGMRGLAFRNGRLYVGSRDGRLVAIDAKTGKLVWSVLTVEKTDGRYITGAPRIIGDKVIIGHGGADSADTRGYVTTYDTESGRQIWRFYIVPGNPAAGFEDETQEQAARTWSGHWWEYGGGGTAWNAFSYDPETDTVFIGTGNGAPWNQKIRSEGKGDNLFLCSIVALDASTGKYKWHYQLNPGESWDYNATMDMQLANLVIDGKLRKVLIQAPKNGFLYVIDRNDGKLISAEKFAKVTWASRINLATGRPVEVPGARYPNGQTFELWPSTLGAHSWQPSAFNPKLEALFIPVLEAGVLIGDAGIQKSGWKRTPGYVYDFGVITQPVKDPQSRTSWLLAVNPVTHETLWRIRTPGMSAGGILTTGSGLVFQGDAEGRFNAYDGSNGHRVWSFDAQAPILGTPISYSLNGKQYITVVSGMGGAATYFGPLMPYNDYRSQPRRVLTFVLDGKEKLRPYSRPRLTAIGDPDYQPDAGLAQRGAGVFEQDCSTCHGTVAVSGGGAPDLRTSAVITSQAAFEAVVRGGSLVDNGMPRFHEFDDSKLAELRQFLREQAGHLRQNAR